MDKLKGSYEYLTGGPDEWRTFQTRNAGLKELGAAVRARTARPGNKEGVVSELVDVFSDGTRMQGTLWKPEAALEAPVGSFPAILLCHGWGGVRDHLDARFGRVFAKAGFVVLTFDYRGWNDSDGVLVTPSQPGVNREQQDAARESDTSHGRGALVEGLRAHIVRQVVDMDWQLTDIEAALDFLSGEPVVDSSRIGLWGISQGGGHVLQIGARHPRRIRAIVAQVPSCGIVGAGNPLDRLGQAQEDAIRRARGKAPLSVPSGVEAGHLPGMDGVPNLRKLCRYQPLATAHLIECPLFVMDAEEEEIFDRRENGMAAFEIVSARCAGSRYAVLPGRHYDAYDGPKGQFKEGTKLAVAFFRENLGAPPSRSALAQRSSTTSSKL